MKDGRQAAGYRLSPQQERLWRAVPEAGELRSACVLGLSATPLAERLTAALARLVERHSILRTRFRSIPGLRLPVQVVEAAGPEAELDWVELASPRAAEEWIEARLAGRATVKDEVTLAAAVGVVPGGETWLALRLPALTADAHSLSRLAGELARAYASPEVEGPDPFEYLRYSEWRHAVRAEDETPEGRDFWRAALAGRQAVLPWLAERPPAATAERRPIPLARSAAAPLLAEAERAGVPPADLLLAGWLGLLRRLGGGREPLLACLDGGRAHRVLADAVGPYARYLPVGADLGGDLGPADAARRLAEWRRVSEPWADDFEAPAEGPWADAAFSFVEWPAAIEAAGLKMRLVDLRAPVEAFAVELSAIRVGSRLRLELLFDPRRLGEVDARYLARLLADALGGAVHGPLAPAERHHLLTELNDTFRAPGAVSREPVHRLFERHAAAEPEAVAVASGAETLSFGALERTANRLARHLRGLGVGPEEAVGLCLERSAELVVVLLGILKAGGAYVPLDPLHPPARLALLLAESGARLLVTREWLWRAIGEPDVETLFLEAAGPALAGRPDHALQGGAGSGHLAYVLFTSGSTGRPKGVMVEHRSLANLAAALEDAVYRRLRRRDRRLRVGLNAPLSFDASVKQWLQLAAGHTLVLVPEEARPDPERWPAFVERRGLDVVDATPSQVAPLSAPPPAVLLLGGEEVSEALWRLLAATPEPCFDLYGPTECTVDASAAAIAGDGPPHLGAPLGNVRLYVVDRRAAPVPRGVEGELAVAGAGLARGYAAAPRATGERFVPDAFGGERGGRLYRTGDRVRRRRDGRLEFRGRADYQVKLRGVRVELGEIEATLRRHPRVREAVAGVRAIEGPGEGERRLVAWVVPGDPARRPVGLRAWLRARLPEVMVPARVVVLERLPLGPGGKLDRSRLPAAVPEPRAARYLAPRNRLERALAEIWRRVLGIEKVGVDDSFFDLGGHSLLLLQAQEAVRERLGRELTLVEMFRHPTVAALARHLAGESPAPDGVDERVRRQRQALARRRPAAEPEEGR